jgi:glucose-1-phosphate cytidylyltransferase
MKVVLFCGGLGTRLREHSGTIPKPLVNIGYRPILWHLMRYYAHFGHKEFILCLGYRGDLIKDYFLNYRETLSNDFTWSDSGRTVRCETEDTADWKVTCVDTGLHANIGERLLAVRHYLSDDEAFLANYSDGLSDLDLHAYVQHFRESGTVASLLGVRTAQSLHAVQADPDGVVTDLGPLRDSDFWVNAGFFCLRSEVFNYIKPGEELVEAPFRRLIADRRLSVYRYDGFWQSMDNLKDKILFDRMEGRGDCPWMVWKKSPQ